MVVYEFLLYWMRVYLCGVRRSQRRCFIKKDIRKISQIYRKTPVPESLL